MDLIFKKIILSFILIVIFGAVYFIMTWTKKYLTPERHKTIQMPDKIRKVIIAIGCIAMLIALWTEQGPFKHFGAKHPDRPYIE